MPNSSRKPKRPIDLNQLAGSIVQAATDGEAVPHDNGKDPLAVELGRRGGLKGGKVRASRLTPEQRRESAQKAAAARWAQK